MKQIEFDYALNQCYKKELKEYKQQLEYLGVKVPKNETTLKRMFNKHLKNIERG